MQQLTQACEFLYGSARGGYLLDMAGVPRRVVCLSAEAVDILYRCGAGDRIVGVSAFAQHPCEARTKPRVSGFSTVQFDKIDALEPDLVITFSDVQADPVRELVRRGHTVLATNQRSIHDIFNTILLLGRVTDRLAEAQALVETMRDEIYAPTPTPAVRPKVYFEEWHQPMISGIRWVSELIEAAGGDDIFPELRARPRASDRVVVGEEVVRRQPDVIVASWCGLKVEAASLAGRPGWRDIPAVQRGQIFEIDSDHILQPGPGILTGLRQLREIVRQFTAALTERVRPQ